AWKRDITYHTFIHESVRKRFLEGFHYDAHPMGMLVSAVAALSTFYLDAKGIFDKESRQKQIIRLIAKMPTLAAAAHRFSVGMPFVYPDNSLDFTSNFLSMMWKVAEPRFEADPVLAKALDLLFILHADHEQNCSTTAMRVVGSSHADPYSATAAAAAALYGPRHGGANEQVIHMLLEAGTAERALALVKERLDKKIKIPGFGHRVYRTEDPRATHLRAMSEELGRRTGHLDLYLTSKQIEAEMKQLKALNANVDFYSASTYYSLGIPIDLFTPIFAVSRMAGWTAHVLEQYRNNRLIRPRADYTGDPVGKSWTPIQAR
ncbi:MAG: citrate/2-methylcitrate synthase, partial [Pseudomonadota bacterium]